MDKSIQRELLARLERDAAVLCSEFGLRYRVLEAERANVKRRYGVCFADGTIRIRLRHVSTGKALKYSSLVNTLCHELAHLRHFNHGPHFQAFYARILESARRAGIYCPGATPLERERHPGAAAPEARRVRGLHGASEQGVVSEAQAVGNRNRSLAAPLQLELFAGMRSSPARAGKRPAGPNRFSDASRRG